MFNGFVDSLICQIDGNDGKNTAFVIGPFMFPDEVRLPRDQWKFAQEQVLGLWIRSISEVYKVAFDKKEDPDSEESIIPPYMGAIMLFDCEHVETKQKGSIAVVVHAPPQIVQLLMKLHGALKAAGSKMEPILHYCESALSSKAVFPSFPSEVGALETLLRTEYKVVVTNPSNGKDLRAMDSMLFSTETFMMRKALTEEEMNAFLSGGKRVKDAESRCNGAVAVMYTRHGTIVAAQAFDDEGKPIRTDDKFPYKEGQMYTLADNLFKPEDDPSPSLYGKLVKQAPH